VGKCPAYPVQIDENRDIVKISEGNQGRSLRACAFCVFGRNRMAGSGNFVTYKRRGERLELIFMMRAVELGFNVSKPWGDSSRHDASVEDKGGGGGCK
jgi:hypothetical protein